MALLTGIAGQLVTAPAKAQEATAGSFAFTAPRQARGGNAVLLDGLACRGDRPAGYCGKVLLAGDGMASELYDPVADSWSGCPAGDASCGEVRRPGNLSVQVVRAGATLTRLDGPACQGAGPPSYCGKVLLVGGTEAPGLVEDANPTSPRARVELYDPASGRWRSCDAASATADCPAPYPAGALKDHSATLLMDGRVLVAGGFAANIDTFTLSGRQDFYTYEPAVGRWSPPGALYNRRRFHRAVQLKGGSDQCGDNCGKVLLVGGAGSGDGVTQQTAELLDPVSRTSTGIANQITPRRVGHSATLLPDGRVLVAGGQASCTAGGFCGNPGDRAEFFDPKALPTAAWVAAANLRFPRFSHTTTLLATGTVLIAGSGHNSNLGELYGVPGSPSLLTGPGPTNPTTATLLPPGPFSVCATSCGKVLLTFSNPSATDNPALGQLYTPNPTMNKLAPVVGPAAGGTAVTIEGTGLASVTSVRFGDLEAASVTPDAQSPDTKLVAVSPPQPAGSVAVTTTSSGGTSASTEKTQFTYATTADPDVVTTPSPPAAGDLPAADSPAAVPPAVLPGILPAPIAPLGVVQPDKAALAIAAEARRTLALRRCLRLALRQKGARRRLAQRRCLAVHGRTPGKVTAFSARALSSRQIQLAFRAAGSDRARPPAARGYVIMQSPRPIRTARDLRRAQALCKGNCRFGRPTLAERLTLTVTGLRPKTIYYYTVLARDNVSGRLGPRSQTVKVTTP